MTIFKIETKQSAFIGRYVRVMRNVETNETTPFDDEGICEGDYIFSPKNLQEKYKIEEFIKTL